MPQPLVNVIVLNWNNHQETARCVASVLRQTYPAFKILIVDNGSTDGSASVLREQMPQIELIALDSNTGYTGGNNIGMARAFAAGADYVWLLNSDAMAAPNTLAALVAAAEAGPGIGMASPVLRERLDDPDITFACGHFGFQPPSTEHTADIRLAGRWLEERPQRVVLSGAALLIRRALWEKIGGLDERLFAYWEDFDYSVRSIAAGFTNIVVLDVSVEHQSKPTSTAPKTIKPHVYYYVARNEILFWMKHVRGMSLLKSIWWHVQRQRRLIRTMRGYQAGIEAIIAGLWDGCRGVHGQRPSSPMPWLLRASLQMILNMPAGGRIGRTQRH